MLDSAQVQSENERMMMEEDLVGSENIKMEMVFHREEMENYIENLK